MGLTNWRASRRELTIEVEGSEAQAEDLCRKALRGLGWMDLDEGGSTVRAGEDPASLCCTVWPVEVEAIFRGDGETTEIELVATTPGRGPIQQRQLRDRLNRLAWEIRHRTETLPGY